MRFDRVTHSDEEASFERQGAVAEPGRVPAPVENDVGGRRPGSRPRLYERETWLEELAAAFAGPWSQPAPVVIEGSPGLGKTALLDAACQLAAGTGMAVLRALAGEHDRRISYGLVRQLFRFLHSATAGRSSLREQLEALVRFIVVDDQGTSLLASPDVHSGLVRCLEEFADNGPLLVAIDGLQWCDEESTEWLWYLVGRLDPARLWFVGTITPHVPGCALRSADRIVADSATRLFSLAPLTGASVADIVRERCVGEHPSEAFVDVCRIVSGGNPFLLLALLDAVRSERVPPNEAGIDRVSTMAPVPVARSVLGRLAALPEDARAVLHAVAVLGDDASLPMVAAVSGVATAAVASSADALAGAYLLHPSRPLRFLYPLERSAVYSEIGFAGRARAHAAAARLLDAHGASPEQVSHHLLASEPAGDHWVVERLEQAAHALLESGQAPLAVRCLDRAVIEPADADARPRVLVELARAEVACGLPSALVHLRQAADLGVDPSVLAEPALRLIQAVPEGATRTMARRLVRDLAERVTPAEEDLRLSLEIAGAVSEDSPFLTPADAAAVESSLGDRLEARTRPERMALAHISFAHTCAGDRGTAADAAQLAERALDPTALALDDVMDVRLATLSLTVLVCAGRFDVADHLARTLQAAALRTGADIAVAEVSSILAHSLLRRGDLADAETESRRALAATGRPWSLQPIAASVLAASLREQGRIEEARQVIDSTAPAWALRPNSIDVFPLEQRGMLELVSGNVDAAIDALFLAGQWAEASGVRNPALSSWRAGASAALAAGGRLGEARRLAAENVERARGFESGWVLGVALRIAGELADGSERLSLLAEAVSRLESSGALLEYARAAIALGIALCAEDRRVEAQAPLRLGADVAVRCGAAPLADEAARALHSAGARPRRLALRGVEALTPAEHRVATLAAAGESNSQIAESLFLSVKTVEGHLSRAYKKLDIRSRQALRSALTRRMSA